MIHLQHGEHTEGNLTVPIYNFHLLTLKLGSALGGNGWTRVVCLRCEVEVKLRGDFQPSGEILRTFLHPCPKRDEP